MKRELVHFNTIWLATHWAPAILNADLTGLSDEEEAILDDATWLFHEPDGGTVTLEFSDEEENAMDELTGADSDCYMVKMHRYELVDSYIDQQIRRLDPDPAFANTQQAKIKITGSHGETNWINIDRATLKAIHAVLNISEE